jgi:hypothetical protein
MTLKEFIMEKWHRLIGSTGSEEEARQVEEEALQAARQRRKLARETVAEHKIRNARDLRRRAGGLEEEELRFTLLDEAQKEEELAKKLTEGEIGFLDAMGLDIDEEDV